VLANIPVAIAFLRASLARLRGQPALTAGYNQQALAQLGEDEWLMRSFVRWNRAAADWLGGRLEPAARGLAEVLAELRAADEFLAGFLPMRVRYDLGEVQRAQGYLDAAVATYRQALEEAGESSQTALTGSAHVVALDTVKKHVTHIMGKLGAANRTEAVARARQLGLIP
jgi:LuxR family maltose regulon positive regulatory protein